MNVKGSCLCGGIEYEIEGPLGKVVNCHCSMCRKATGAAFRTRAAVPRKAFRWVLGEHLVSRYASSAGETRTFCRVCGSTLPTFFRDRPDEIGLPLGTLDDDPKVRPSAHVWIDSKAPWWEITDTLPQYAEAPPWWQPADELSQQGREPEGQNGQRPSRSASHATRRALDVLLSRGLAPRRGGVGLPQTEGRGLPTHSAVGDPA